MLYPTDKGISPEWDTFISLFKLQLLFQRECNGLSTHVEHVINNLLSTMVLQTDEGTGQLLGFNETEDGHVLPETICDCSLPKALDLSGIARFEEFVVNDLQLGHSRNIIGKRGELCSGHFCKLILILTSANTSSFLYSSSR